MEGQSDAHPDAPLVVKNFTAGQPIIAAGLRELMRIECSVQSVSGGGAYLAPTPENIRTFMLALHAELSELLAELSIWKPWKTPKRVNEQRVVEEFADVLAFQALIMHYLCVLTGISADDLAREFVAKSIVNVERLAGRVEGYGLHSEQAAPGDGEID